MNSREKPTYFFSDSHLGAGTGKQERLKLDRIALLLGKIAGQKATCFILGDLFDFWFEFRGGIPNGYDEILKMLGAATERGAELHLIGGNHDWWANGKLEAITGVIVHKTPFIGRLGGLKIYASHGDGLARSDRGYRLFLKPIFRNRLNNWLFEQLPESLGQALMKKISNGSRLYTKQRDLRLEAEYVEAAAEICASGEIDLVIIGHTHEPARIVELSCGLYANTGEFFEKFSYIVLEEGELRIEFI